MMKSCILGTGHYLPDRVVTNFDLAEVMDTSNEFIMEHTGIATRRFAEPETSATDLAALACRAAMDDAGVGPDEIDLLVMNTITPDHPEPGCAFFLQPKLGMAGIPVLDIRQQCAAFIYELSLADHYIKVGTCRRVLVVCAETNSKFLDYSNEGRNLTVLLGDGAGAAVLGPAEDGDKELRSVIVHADGIGARSVYRKAPGSALNRSEHLTVEDIETGRIHSRMNGKFTAEHGVAKMSSVMHEILEANSLSIDDIDLIVPHQPNLRMLEAIVENTGFPQEKFFINVVEHGNMASATTPIALDQARRAGRAGEGALVLVVAFGAGFSWGAALVRM
jgi:3-oxoacyl-[acyl-carrier-protein] synthase-3